MLRRAAAPRRQSPPLARPGPDEWLTLIAVVDDATKQRAPCRAARGRGKRGEPIMPALRTVFERHGVPMALYTDRAHWAAHTPIAGGAPDRRISRRSAAPWPGSASSISWATRPKPAAGASASTGPCRIASSTSSASPASPPLPGRQSLPPRALPAGLQCRVWARRPRIPVRLRAAAAARSRADPLHRGGTSRRPRQCRHRSTGSSCSSPSNPAAAPAPDYRSWSAAISPATTPSGTARGVWAASTPGDGP